MIWLILKDCKNSKYLLNNSKKSAIKGEGFLTLARRVYLKRTKRRKNLRQQNYVIQNLLWISSFLTKYNPFRL